MTNKEALRKVAFYCNEYDPLRIYIGPTARSYEDKYENCINCINYKKENKCSLNLIDSSIQNTSNLDEIDNTPF